MRTKIITLTTLLAFAAGTALAQTPAQAVQDVQQYNQDVHQLSTDIRNNRADLRKDDSDADHQRHDIDRDESLASADRTREEQDLRDGNRKGAAYWDQQRKDERADIGHDRKDLAHSRRDIRNDKTRLAKDEKVRHHDVAKRSRAAKKV